MISTQMKYDIKDIKLSEMGKKRIEWAAKDMPVLSLISRRFDKEKPLKDIEYLPVCM